MIVAVCIVCGAEKPGPFETCPNCRFSPNTVVDNAKSFLMSSSNMPTYELYRLQSLVISKAEIPYYDPVCLAISADRIAELNYFAQYFDEKRGALKCLNCGNDFRPTAQEVFCVRCISEIEPQISTCRRCEKIFGNTAKYCADCGTRLTPEPRRFFQELTESLTIAIRRAADGANSSIEMCGFDDTRFPIECRAAVEVELEIFATYICSLALRVAVPASVLFERILARTVQLLQRGYLMEGLMRSRSSPELAELWNLWMRRCDEYDRIMERDRNNFVSLLVGTAARNCFSVIQNDLHLVRAATEVLRHELAGMFFETSQRLVKTKTTCSN